MNQAFTECYRAQTFFFWIRSDLTWWVDPPKTCSRNDRVILVVLSGSLSRWRAVPFGNRGSGAQSLSRGKSRYYTHKFEIGKKNMNLINRTYEVCTYLMKFEWGHKKVLTLRCRNRLVGQCNLSIEERDSEVMKLYFYLGVKNRVIPPIIIIWNSNDEATQFSQTMSQSLSLDASIKQSRMVIGRPGGIT